MDYPRNPKEFTRHFALDYYRRPRPLRRWKWLLSIVAALGCTAAMAAIVSSRQHTAFQAAPVSHAHARFGDDCSQCHDKPFATAHRFLPWSDAHTVSDDKCVACHQAGNHNEHQLKNKGGNGQAAGCVECHHEHQGARLTQLPDQTCVECHGGQPTGAAGKFKGEITAFAKDHPEFGAWRGQPLTDPAGGAFRFNHKRHFDLAKELAAVPKHRKKLVGPEFERLQAEQCSYCHQPAADGRTMKPIRYANHCAACHPIQVAPSENSPRRITEALPHPRHGQDVSLVRGALFERYLQSIVADQANKPREPIPEPAIIGSSEDQERRRRAQLDKLATERTADGERWLFRTPNVGCQECHVLKWPAEPDKLPEVLPPRQQTNRWLGVVSEWPASRMNPATEVRNPGAYADDRNRWFPYSTFDHYAHRVYACIDCHRDERKNVSALESRETSDLLMPSKANCVKCHDNSAQGPRSDCLACHSYHDRTQQIPAPAETPPVLDPRQNFRGKP